MANLDKILKILDEGIDEVIKSTDISVVKLANIENMTSSFIAIVKDFKFIHTLKKEKELK